MASWIVVCLHTFTLHIQTAFNSLVLLPNHKNFLIMTRSNKNENDRVEQENFPHHSTRLKYIVNCSVTINVKRFDFDNKHDAM